MSKQYIYQIDGLAKKHGPREVLEGHLALVLSRRQDRRAGSQRLGQEHAAADHGRRRQRVRRRGQADRRIHRRLRAARAGHSIPTTDVCGNIEQAVAGPAQLLTTLRRNQRPLRRADGRRGDGQAAGRAGARAGQDRRRQRLGAGSANRNRHGRDAASARRRRRDDPLRRRAAPRGPVQDAAAEARLAAARRTDEPSRRRKRGLARTPPGRVHRHGRRRDARSVFPRQRGGLDSGTRPRPRHSLGRELLLLARAKSESAGAGRKSRLGAAEDVGPRAGMDSHWPRALGRPRARPASSAYEKMSAEAYQDKIEEFEMQIPPGPALGRTGDRARQRSRRATATGC